MIWRIVVDVGVWEGEGGFYLTELSTRTLVDRYHLDDRTIWCVECVEAKGSRRKVILHLFMKVES